MKNKQTAANLILLLVAAIWGGGFIAGKMALTGLSPAAIIAYRYGMGALMCGIIFWKRVAKTSKDVMKKGILIGALQAAGQAVQLIGKKQFSVAYVIVRHLECKVCKCSSAIPSGTGIPKNGSLH